MRGRSTRQREWGRGWGAMTKRRQVAKRAHDVVLAPNGISGEAQLRALALVRWAQTGKRPANLDGWRLDPQTADAVLEHLGPMALAAQVKALDHALRPGATEQAITTGAMTAKDMLNRKL